MQKYRLMKCPLIQLLLLCLILLSEKMYFTAKYSICIYNFYGTDLNVCRGVFRTQSKIYDGAFLRKSQKSFIVELDWVLNTSLIQVLQQNRFIEATIYLIQSKPTSKIFHCALIYPINKTHFGLKKKMLFLLRYFCWYRQVKYNSNLNKNTISPKRIMVLCCVTLSNFSTQI